MPETAELRVRALAASAEALALSGDLDRAAETIDRARELARDTPSLIAVARAMAAICPLDRAARAAHAIERADERAVALARAGVTDLPAASPRALAEALLLLGDVDRAVTTAEQDPDRGRGMGGFVRALIRAGRLDHAYATACFLVTSRPERNTSLAMVAEAMGGERALEVAEHITDPSCLSGALRTAALALDDHRTPDLLLRAEAAARAITNPGERETRLTDLAIAWAERGDPDRARAVVPERGRWVLARCFLRMNRPAEAAGILDDAPSGNIAVLLARAGAPDRAIACARSIPDMFEQQVALAEVAEALADGGHADRAREVLDDAATRSLAIDGYDDVHHVHGLARLARALFHAGCPGRAVELLEEAQSLIHTLDDEHDRFGSWRLLAACYGRAGLLDRADAIAASRWPSPWPDLVRALCDVGRFDDARVRAAQIPDPEPRSWALTRVAEGHVELGRIDEAEAIALAVEEPAARGHALLAVAQARTRAGRLNHAVSLLDRAESAARAVPGAHDRDKLLNGIAGAFLAIGRRDRSAEVLAALAPAPEVMIARGDLDRALRAALDLTDPDAQCRALALVGEAWFRAGRGKQVLLHARTAVTPDPETRALLARAHAVAGEDGLLSPLLTAPLSGRAQVYAAEALSLLGRHDEAVELAGGRAEVLAAVAVTMAGAGETQRALDLARSLAEGAPRAWALAEVSRVLARTGDFTLITADGGNAAPPSPPPPSGSAS